MQETLKILIPVVVAHACVLVAIIFVIKRMLLSDTLNAVDRIRQVEAEVRKKEETIRREIEEHEKDFAQKKAEAEEELRKQRDASEKEVGRLKEQTLGEARKEADRILDQAKKNEEKLRQQIAQDMEEKAVDYGADVFKLVVSDVITADLNKLFVGELLDALQEIEPGSITVDSKQADIRCSHPMDPEQKQRFEGLLKEKFGATIQVNEATDKDLLAGMSFKLGSLEIDGSLRNRFREAAQEVKKTAHV
jgi:F0F1-type ATP synthase delta subunit